MQYIKETNLCCYTRDNTSHQALIKHVEPIPGSYILAKRFPIKIVALLAFYILKLMILLSIRQIWRAYFVLSFTDICAYLISKEQHP